MSCRTVCLLVVVLGLGCAGRHEQTESPQRAPESQEPVEESEQATPPALADPLALYEGRYELISADRDINECPIELSVGVTEILVSVSPPILHTVGEDRDYEIRVEDGDLLGEARFPSQVGSDGACPDSTIFERWRLTLREDHSLVGVHEALWLFPPNCTRPCRVSFDIVTGPRGVTGLRDSI